MSAARHLLSASLAVALIGIADARPVSYPSGWTVMQRNTGDFASLHVHYSPTFRDSIGAYAEQNWETDFTFVGGQYNRLLRRWNGIGSQANAYLNLGLGGASPFGDDDSHELASFAGIAADWETRRWFVSYAARGYALGFDEFAGQTARVGIAPYIGDFGDLHTWLMLEVRNVPEADTPTTLTPLVRFFYGTELLEIGYTPETNRFMTNWIVRF